LKDNQLYNSKRRLFLKKVIKLIFIVISFSFISSVLAFLKPKNPKKKPYRFFEIPSDKIPKEGVKRVDIAIDEEKTVKVFLVKHNNSLIALSPVCTHLGCFVNFDRNINEFVCPCHGGRYNIEGKVIKGPPQKNLQRFPIKIKNNKILVGIKI